MRPNCCGGGNGGPIRSELYVRTGPALAIDEGGVLGQVLGTGWEIQGGGRSLFYDPEGIAAWTIDLSLANIHNHADRQDLFFAFEGDPTRLLSIRSLNRTFVSFGLGREWSLPFENWAWRRGGDMGGRLGTARLDLNDPALASNYRRLNDTYWAIYLALHADVEISRGCCTWVGGVRAEWDYNFLDIFPGQPSDLQDVNLLLNVGVRF